MGSVLEKSGLVTTKCNYTKGMGLSGLGFTTGDPDEKRGLATFSCSSEARRMGTVGQPRSCPSTQATA